MLPHYACERNPDTKGHILFDSTYMNYAAYWAERREGSEEQLLNGCRVFFLDDKKFWK